MSEPIYKPTDLFNREGNFVATVMIPRMKPMPEVVTWGVRTFVWCAEQFYREGLALQVHTATELGIKK